MNKLMKVYGLLMEAYCPQGWWPVTDAGKKKPSYRKRHKLSVAQRFEIIIGSILTQNTSWKNVEKSIESLHGKRLLSIDALKALPEKKLAELIRSSGYFNQKAKKIKAIIAFLESGKPIKRQNLLEIWGVGPETADSIMLYAYNKPFFVVDTYTRRIFCRLGLTKERASYDELQKFFHENLPANPELFNEYHALIVEHAKRHCAKKPNCESCPLRELCPSEQGKGL